jgi:hypothetical protein
MHQLIGPQAALFERALAQSGLTRDDVRIDPHDRAFFGGDKYRLPFFDSLMDNPWKVSPYLRGIGDQLLADNVTMPQSVVSMHLRLNEGIRLNLLGDPTEPYAKQVAEAGDDSLFLAIAQLEGVNRPTLAQTKEVPKPVREAAALYLFALPEIIRLRHNALEPIARATEAWGPIAYGRTLRALAAADIDTGIGEPTDDSLLLEKMADACDWGQLNAGATLAAFVAQKMHDDLTAASLDNANFELQFETPYGWVQLSGGQPNTHRDHPNYALILDTGGHDQYGSAAVSYFNSPCSVCIDLAGDDQYTSTDANPAFGAGVFGYGLLLDGGGNDNYESMYAGQGCGIFGTGVLWDSGGEDTYSGVSSVQGSGAFGTGVLIDDAGNDTYDCYQLSQAYGYTLGAGLLLDRAGNDVYRANDTDIRYPSAQSAEHNSSLAQGMGMGRRADYSDGHSWAGGVGLLMDGAGDDKYSCAVFGQGCAYWYGVGALLDRAGADEYSGMWYVQGAGAHFALSVLQDDAGNDRYNATMNMAQGAGHDFTLGWLEDSAGNDAYSAPNLSLGGANANGIGVFWDKGGDDTYVSSGVTLGAGGGVSSPGLRPWMLNLGIFVDGGGRDGYWEGTTSPAADVMPVPWDFAGDGRAWQRPGMSDPKVQNEYGVGIDG